MKFHPDFPNHFLDYDEAHLFCKPFFDWYNNEHLRGGIDLRTHAMLHHSVADQVIEERQHAMGQVMAKHTERFVKRKLTIRKLYVARIDRPRKQKLDENTF